MLKYYGVQRQIIRPSIHIFPSIKGGGDVFTLHMNRVVRNRLHPSDIVTDSPPELYTPVPSRPAGQQKSLRVKVGQILFFPHTFQAAGPQEVHPGVMCLKQRMVNETNSLQRTLRV